MTVIQHYKANTQAFAQPVNYKVRRLLELNLIHRITDGLYQINPIPHYNSTIYQVREQLGKLQCNCQCGRKGRECAHVRAVRIYQTQTEPKEQQLHIL